MSMALVRPDGKVDVSYVSGGRSNVITLPVDEFDTIRRSFTGENCLVVEKMAIDMTNIVDYVEETNPLFVQAQVTIETDKVRRSMGRMDIGKWLMPIGIILIIIVIIAAITSSGDTSSVPTAQTIAGSVSVT